MGKIIFLALGLFFSLANAAENKLSPSIEISRPEGGWRNSFGESVEYTQSVNYPASSVNVQEGQSKSALIEGKLLGFPEEDKTPFKLIVNGIAMPMRVDNARFARPYSFGSGSNNVEVRSPDGKTRKRVQFYENYQTSMSPNLRIVLSWDTDGTDLDLHVVTPEGEHCYYGNRILKNGSALDVDVTTGYGPEIFSTPAPSPGTYLVYVNYYGSGSNAKEANLITVAKLTTITHENTPDEKQETVIVPMRTPGDLTLVHSFSYP